MSLRALRCPLLLLCCMLALAAYADEVPPDQALLIQAQQAAAAGQWSDVAIVVENLRKQYPKSEALPAGMVLLYQAYSLEKATEKSAAVGKEIVARWPKSEYVWQVVLFTCKQKAKVSAQDAIASLDLALRQDMLSAADRTKAQKQRLQFEQQAKAEQQFIATLQQVKALTPDAGKDELVAAARLAQQIYPALFAADRREEAKEIHDKLCDLLAKAGNPNGQVQANQRAFLDAIKTVDPKQYIEEALAIIQAAKDATSVEEALLASTLAGPLYLEQLRKRPYEEMKALHDGLQEAFKRLQMTPDQMRYETNAWLGGLLAVKPEKLAEEMTEIIARMQEVKTADEVIFRAEFSFPLYTGCFKNKKPELAKELHEKVQAYYNKFQLTDDALTDTAQFRVAQLFYWRDTDRERFLTEASTTLVEITDAATQFTQLSPVINITIWYGLYQDLFTSGRSREATALHDHLHGAYVRLKYTNAMVINQNKSTYLTAYGSSNSAGFLSVYLPLVLKTAKDANAEDMKVLVDVSRFAYGALLRSGRLEEAKIVHQQLQAGIRRLQDVALAETEYQRYFTALSESAPPVFLAEMQPMLDALAKAQAIDEVLPFAPAIRMGYSPLNRTNHFSLTRAAHKQMQVLLTKAGRADEAALDARKYRESLSTREWEIMLQSCKKAVAEKDAAAAKLWLDELLIAAPDSPQATQAKAIWKESGLAN